MPEREKWGSDIFHLFFILLGKSLIRKKSLTFPMHCRYITLGYVKSHFSFKILSPFVGLRDKLTLCGKRFSRRVTETPGKKNFSLCFMAEIARELRGATNKGRVSRRKNIYFIPRKKENSGPSFGVNSFLHSCVVERVNTISSFRSAGGKEGQKK